MDVDVYLLGGVSWLLNLCSVGVLIWFVFLGGMLRYCVVFKFLGFVIIVNVNVCCLRVLNVLCLRRRLRVTVL